MRRDGAHLSDTNADDEDIEENASPLGKTAVESNNTEDFGNLNLSDTIATTAKERGTIPKTPNIRTVASETYANWRPGGSQNISFAKELDTYGAPFFEEKKETETLDQRIERVEKELKLAELEARLKRLRDNPMQVLAEVQPTATNRQSGRSIQLEDVENAIVHFAGDDKTQDLEEFLKNGVSGCGSCFQITFVAKVFEEGQCSGNAVIQSRKQHFS